MSLSRGRGKSPGKGRSKCPASAAEVLKFKAFIRNIYEVNTLDQTIGFDIWIAAWSCAEGRATTVFQKAQHDGVDDVIFDSHSSFGEIRPVWHLNLQNAKDVKYIYREKQMPTVRCYPNGGGSFERQHIHCTVINNLKLEEFPFDTQNFELTVSLDVSTALARFAQPDPNKETCELDGDTNISKDSASEKMLDETEWHSATSRKTRKGEWVFGAVAHCEHVNEKVGVDGYSRIKIQIPVQRNPSSHFYTLMVPLFIVTTSAFYAFYIPQKDIGDRLSYLSTLLLTVFAFKWSAAEKLPKTKKISFIMELFQMAYIFISIVMAAGCTEAYEATAECGVIIAYSYMLWNILLKYRNSAKARRDNIHFQRKVKDRTDPVSIHDALKIKDGDPGSVPGESVFIYSTVHNGSIYYHVIDWVFSHTFMWVPISAYLFAVLLIFLYFFVWEVDSLSKESKKMVGQCASFFSNQFASFIEDQTRSSVEKILRN